MRRSLFLRSMPFTNPHAIRAMFADAMSKMYQKEVPLYGDLIQIVQEANAEYLDKYPQEEAALENSLELPRLGLERHGAIRVGKASELSNIRRVFSVMGMEPVAYYDLASAGVPVHSTAFRAVTREAMGQSPFRIFCSLLRLDLIKDETLRARAEGILKDRQIFSLEAMRLLELSERKGGLEPTEAATFVEEVLKTFRWHSEATVTSSEYEALSAQHRLIADVVAFKGPHINHLTPRTLDIDRVQELMPARGIDTKLFVEGPPSRKCPILLRQTSFKALNEDILFVDREGKRSNGKHSARFGEIEQRGVALTEKGRKIYDSLLSEVRNKLGGSPTEGTLGTYYKELANIFDVFPDTHEELFEQGLAFYHFYPTEKGLSAAKESPPHSLDGLTTKEMVSKGYLRIDPITYEDFLPVSAAGIFQSNLGDAAKAEGYDGSSNQQLFENDLGATVRNEIALYKQDSDASLKVALKQLGC